MQRLTENITPLIIVQAILSLAIVAAFVYQEVVLHSVDVDLKLLTFGIIGYWLGGIAFTGQVAIMNRNKTDE